MRRLRIRVVMVSVAVAALALVAFVLGSVAERANSKSFVGYDGTSCVYRRTAALCYGIAAAVFVLAGQAMLAAASGCFGRCGDGEPRAHPITGRRPRVVPTLTGFFWTLTAAAMCVFLYGTWRNTGATSRPTRGRYRSMRGCRMRLGRGIFSTAAASSALAFVFGIIAYIYQEMPDTEEPQGVAMPPVFQPQQAYPAMGYPAAPPPPPYGGHGAKAPADTAAY